VASPLFSRIGQLAGLPEHAVRLLEDDRILMVYPEGVRGLGKLHTERYELAGFGTGFVRIALESRSPIVPFGVIGAEEAYPVVARLEPLARLMGLPYIPVPSHLVPVPLPRTCTIRYGEPLYFEGTGHEGDEVIADLVEQVKVRVDELIAPGRERSS
jgi:1-acyl-sn-glycerol-3-phosphate acyltransferase